MLRLQTQGDMSRDMCRGSSLHWSGVLVGVFFANSADKLNMLQLGAHITTCSSSFEHLTKFFNFPGYGRLEVDPV